MNDADRHDERRWRPRPLLAFALRLVSVLVPTAAGAASAYAFFVHVPRPSGPGGLLWFLGLAITSTTATALAERLGRRFLPLAVLFRLSLVFPDRAPSRFTMARGAGNVRNLERRIRDARSDGVDEEPARAAGQILSLVAALSAHDRKTRGHSERVRAFTDLVADELRLGEHDRDRLRWASLLHDVGKLDVPARILNKPGKPDPREWETLKGHPAAGARIAAPLLPWLGPWGHAIEQHHERFDGDGYPKGLAGEDIAMAARIVSVADSFEVMTASRSYKKPMSVMAARRELAACAGGQFDPAVVRAFLNVSLGRLWWAVGPTSWTALLPVIGPIQRAGGQLAATAGAATAAVVVSTGGLVSMIAGIASANEPPAVPIVSGVQLREATGGEPTDDDDAGDDGDTEDPDDDEPGTDPGKDPGTDPGKDPGTGPGKDPEDPNVVDETVDTVDEVVDRTTDVLDGVVDETTNVLGGDGSLDELAGGVTGTVDDTVDDTTDGIGDLLGS